MLCLFLAINRITHLFRYLWRKVAPNERLLGLISIYRSVLTNNLIVLKELLELGANGNIANNMNETPLYQSVEMENYDAMIILLKYNCDCNICKKKW